MLPTPAYAAFWGVLAASGLLIGALVAVAFDARLTAEGRNRTELFPRV
jgi:hypothetical protein